MRGKYKDKFNELLSSINDFENYVCPLKGIEDEQCRSVFVKQIISSLRRVEYVRMISLRPPMKIFSDPNEEIFDPLRAAVYYRNRGDRDEAAWLVFLATHFGKHSDDGWRLLRDVYGSFGQGPIWYFEDYKVGYANFRSWITNNGPRLFNDGVSRRYSSHRQYESKSPVAICSVLEAYLDLLGPSMEFDQLLLETQRRAGQEPTSMFAELFSKCGEKLVRFGRLGVFDFLTMLGKLDLAPIAPGSTFLVNATGPLRGAKLLVYGDTSINVLPSSLEQLIDSMDDFLKVGKQVLEDSICNWQKNPSKYVYFRG